MRATRALTLAGLVVSCFALTGCATTAATAGTSSAHTRTEEVPRASRASTNGIVVVGLGDSVMSGEHCGCGGPVAAYAALIRKREGIPVTVRNLGVPGATTTSVLAQLRRSSVVAAVRRARVVAIIVGANDLHPQLQRFQSGGCPSSCYLPAVHAMGRRMDRLLDRVDAIRHGRPGQVILADYWNVFVDGQQALQSEGAAYIAWSRALTRVADREICHAGADRGHACAHTYAAFLGSDDDPTRYLAADGDHPNRRGVQLIAQRLYAVTKTSLLR